jgi:hypothetical protein
VRALALSPQIPAGCPSPCTLEAPIYAATLTGLFKSTNGGESWFPSNRGLPSRQVIAIAVDPSDPSTLYATLSGRGLAKSTDGGRTGRR